MKDMALISIMPEVNLSKMLQQMQFRRILDKEMLQKIVPHSESNVYFLPWTNYTSAHIMGDHGHEVLPPTTMVDQQYVLTTISDYVNFTFPSLHSFPTMRLQLDSLEIELKKQMEHVSNISVQVKGLKEDTSKDSPFFWTHLPLLLHAG